MVFVQEAINDAVRSGVVRLARVSKHGGYGGERDEEVEVLDRPNVVES